MALIQCPECGKSVSDKALSCIHCGFPLQNSQPKYYDLIYMGFRNRRDQEDNLSAASILMSRLIGTTTINTMRFLRRSNQRLISGLTEESALMVRDYFGKYGCIIEFTETDSQNTDNNMKVKNLLEDAFRVDDTQLVCPRCRSTSVSIGTKGYSIITGFIGSNRTVNRCGKCGYSWEPGR